jgi:hypothetical protein
MAGKTDHEHYFAVLKRTDPDRLRRITQLGGLNFALKHDNNRVGLVKARAALAAKVAAARAEKAALVSEENGGTQ